MKQRQYIRHLSGISVDASLTSGERINHDGVVDISAGGLAFDSQSPLPIGAMVTIQIPQIDLSFNVTGEVAWIKENDGGCTMGIAFTNRDEAFRARMVEQVCLIESYWRHARENDGRNITIEEAANEWISRFAAEFPKH